MPEWTQWLTLGIAVLGALGGGISFFWQIWKDRQARKDAAESKKEKVAVSLITHQNLQGEFLLVTVVNDGERPIFLKRVELIRSGGEAAWLEFNKAPGDETETTSRLISIPVSSTCPFMAVKEGLVSHPRARGEKVPGFIPCPEAGDDPLLPGADRKYALPTNHPGLLISIEGPGGPAWISISSAKGEIYKLEGAELAAHVRFPRRPPSPSPPPPSAPGPGAGIQPGA